MTETATHSPSVVVPFRCIGQSLDFAEGIQSAEDTSAVDSFVVASFGSSRSDFDLVVLAEVGCYLAGSQSTAAVTVADRSYCFEKRSEARRGV